MSGGAMPSVSPLHTLKEKKKIYCPEGGVPVPTLGSTLDTATVAWTCDCRVPLGTSRFGLTSVCFHAGCWAPFPVFGRGFGKCDGGRGVEVGRGMIWIGRGCDRWRDAICLSGSLLVRMRGGTRRSGRGALDRSNPPPAPAHPNLPPPQH